MIWVAHGLRIGVIAICLFVLSGIIPISLAHFQVGNACPNLGPIPACYVVSVAYTLMAVAAALWWRKTLWLFLIGATPVILLAAVGTTAELTGRPTCPRSDTGLPLCYFSLAVGLSLLAMFLAITVLQKKAVSAV